MGSDGGGGSFGRSSGRSTQEIDAIFDDATSQTQRQIDEEQREHRKRNVFISFHNEDEAQVELLRMQSQREEYDLEFNDYSVHEPINEKWRQEVKERISRTSATIVMIGEQTAERPNVLFEINESYRQHKKVIGVRIYGDKNHIIPRPMLENNAPIVAWKLSDIQAELDRS